MVWQVSSISCSLSFQGKDVQESASACVVERDEGLEICVVNMDDHRQLLEAVGDALVSRILQVS